MWNGPRTLVVIMFRLIHVLHIRESSTEISHLQVSGVNQVDRFPNRVGNPCATARVYGGRCTDYFALGLGCSGW